MTFRLLARNVIDEALSATASPSALSTHPLSRVQQQGHASTRTTSLATQTYTFTWSSDQTMNMVALARHNLRTAGTIRVQVYSDAACTTLLEDSTALAAFSTTGLSTLDVYRYLQAVFRGKKCFAYYFTATRTTVRGLKITITDAANPDGFMEFSRLLAGLYFQPSLNPDYGGLGLEQASLSGQVRTDGGELKSDARARYRTERITHENIPDETDLAEFLAIADYLDKERDFWFSFYPGEGGAKEIYHQGVFKFTQLGALEPNYFSHHKAEYVMAEA